MEDSVKKIIDSMTDHAKSEALNLAAQLEAEGQITLPQPLATGEWTNSKGEVFSFTIMLDMSNTEYGRLLGFTSLRLYTIHDEKYVTDNYAGMVEPFVVTVFSEAFWKETEKKIGELIAEDGKRTMDRISNDGICAIHSFVIPEIARMDMRKLPSDCTLAVFGAVFEGIDGIKDYVRSQTDSSQPYIIVHSIRFPCFDAEDYATERRFYRNFLICQSKTEADKKERHWNQLRESNRSCLVNDNLPANMRPMVYFEDESSSIRLAF